MKKIFLIGGARPNFMKLAPLLEELKKYPSKFNPILVHTGQHYDYELSGTFFYDLVLPEPDLYLGVGSGTHGDQTGRIMIEFEKVVLKEKPDLIIVVGDVNSTLACAVVGSKLMIPIVHVEAGLRSFDRSMPEEINRLVTDMLSDYLFTTEESGNKNLLHEGIPNSKIYFVGDIMIDSLFKSLETARKSNILKKLGLRSKEYAILTLHRPSNVDTKKILSQIISAIEEITKSMKIVFPIHPRTKKNVAKFNLSLRLRRIKNLILTQSLGYLDFLCLEKNANFVLTDSGSIQGETTVLNIPCLTLRKNTERPITLEIGTNSLVGNNKSKIVKEAFKIIDGKSPSARLAEAPAKRAIRRAGKKGKIPPLWDGHTAERIVKTIIQSVS
ncbi:UDP-N-acetylglucosamine 2-epimerase (non-hydrolyzing) [candidate division WOR-3 bacterium]|nr:UDP-N-acetylglucosamine 2-epimerase (non-hydrolyzing) [candidate division WOR-3 bacterium]